MNKKSILRREYISFVLQDNSLFEQYDVLGNMQLYAAFHNKRYSEEKYRQILKSVNLDIPLHQSIQTLSGGQKQRVAIACALCNDTEIIISQETQNELAIATPKATNSVIKKVSKQNDISKHKSKLDTYLAITEKQKEVIAKNENKTTPQEQTNQKSTYNYVNPETLLAEVQGNKKPNGNTNTYKSTLKVNPNDLLNSVESELDQSFKDKALTKFKQAKSVFVNRNYN